MWCLESFVISPEILYCEPINHKPVSLSATIVQICLQNGIVSSALCSVESISMPTFLVVTPNPESNNYPPIIMWSTTEPSRTPLLLKQRENLHARS